MIVPEDGWKQKSHYKSAVPSCGVDNYHTNRRVHKGFPANSFKGSRLQKRLKPAKPPSPSLAIKDDKVENLMTLKQACSSEYQGAQGAFKDSMIH